MRYSFRQLEVFVAVARAESVSRAAENLAMTQSATSMALTELEKQFSTRLFDRHGKRLQLNELGRQLLPQAMELLDRATEIENSLSGDAGIGSMRIGATLTIGNYLATLLIGDFMRQHPHSRVQLEVHNTSTVVDQVAHFQLDLGLIEGEAQHPELDIVPWVGDEMVVFAAPEHPLARQASVSLEELAHEPWILRERGSGTRQVFDAALRHLMPRLDIRLELEHTEAIKRAVESGLGIGCISRLALKDAFRRGSLVPLPIRGLDLQRSFYFVLHRQKYRTRGIEAFMQLCRDVAAGAEYSHQIIMRRPDGQPLEYR